MKHEQDRFTINFTIRFTIALDGMFQEHRWKILHAIKQSIEYVKAHKHITISEYIALNKVSDKTARLDLNDLIEKRIFFKEGVTTGLKFKLTSVNFGHMRWTNDERNEVTNSTNNLILILIHKHNHTHS